MDCEPKYTLQIMHTLHKFIYFINLAKLYSTTSWWLLYELQAQNLGGNNPKTVHMQKNKQQVGRISRSLLFEALISLLVWIISLNKDYLFSLG